MRASRSTARIGSRPVVAEWRTCSLHNLVRSS